MKAKLTILCLACICQRFAVADITLVDNRLSVGGFVRGRAEYWRYQQEVGQSHFGFLKGLSLLWLGARLTGESHYKPSLGVNMLFDAGRPAPVDLFASVQWPSGYLIRAGQFKLPLSFETDVRPDRAKLLDYPLAVPLLKPNGTRDIGILFGWQQQMLEAFFSIVNGSGANASDDNKWKDLSARIVLRPTNNAAVGGTIYYGRTGAEGAHWVSPAADALWTNGGLRLQAMGLYFLHQDDRTITGNLAVAYDFGWIEPVARFDMMVRRDQRPEIMPLLGLNFWILDERFRVTADYQYHRHFGADEMVPWLYQQLSLTVQAGF